MPNLEDCVIQFEDPNPTMTRVENAPAGVGVDIVFPSVEPEHLRGRSLSAIRPMTVTEYNSIHADNYKTEKNTGNIILIMIVATICLIKVIRAAKKLDQLNMTTEQEKDFKKRGIYNDIILMTNLTMIYCYIMFFALEEVVNIFGKRYRHSTKYYYNIVREVLDRINCDNINCFKTSQQDAGQMVLDVVKEIEDRLVFDDKQLYILFVINQKAYDNIHRFEPEVTSIFKKQIEYIYRKLIDYCPVTLDKDKMAIATIVINQVINKIKAREESNGSLTIIYDDTK